MKRTKYLLKVMTFVCLTMTANSFSETTKNEGHENENDFLEFYSINKDLLDAEAPYAYSLESFAEYHDALLSTVSEFERNGEYEDEFPVEGKITQYQNNQRTIKFFNFLLNEVTATDKGSVCFFGGWPSRTYGRKCQSPWKNSNDQELKQLGGTYNSNSYCGGKNLFRCNPLFFGPGKNGKGTCVKFNSVSEISTKCYIESRDQIEQIYKSFKTNSEFREKYLATVNAMINFCLKRTDYPACSVLTLQVKKMTELSCGQTFDLNKLLSRGPIVTLSKDYNEISKGNVKPTPPTEKVTVKEKPTYVPIPKPAPVETTSVITNSSKICSLYKKFVNKGVPAVPLLQLLTYYNESKSRFSNDRYVSFADYSQNSKYKRFYLLDLVTGEVITEKVSHGSGLLPDKSRPGDPDHDGMLNSCKQANGSKKNMTRPGFYKVGSYYHSDRTNKEPWPKLVQGTNYNGMQLDGLSTTNGDALGKGVVMHEANYNIDSIMGRSTGCPAFVPGRGAPCIQKMKGGSLFYAYAPVCKEEMNEVLRDRKVGDWKNTCK